MKQIAPLVYAWSQHDAARRLDVHGYFLQRRAGEPGVLVDPVPLHEGDEAHLRELGGATAVVRTGEDRHAAAGRCAETLGLSVLLARAGGDLPAGLAALPLPQGAALFHAPSGSALPGSGVEGAPAG